MSDRHALAPLRRWLLQSGTPAKLAVLLVAAVLMIATSVMLLSNAGDGSRSDLIEIDGPAATTR
ncbi:hypothetical protein E1212_13375 [Jiangella ureilytica]|uniref:Uncharacterized protein n=1 Tax=Jiangella ureilytica TaxID=2530374 RepID=A0A4R4RMR9_9ACTN|nr:hypothetical protein [Jiangella ureilytica]TDC50930.1 hypothetical protein E1212_13375 [Jiangella ureilytica]